MRAEIYSELMRLQVELVDSCDICGGSGYLQPEHPGETNPCRCMTVHTYLCALIEAKLPRDYWWLELDAMEVAEEYKTFCTWYIDRLEQAVANGLGVLFMGPNGIGKTSMQCAIGKAAIVAGHTVQYYTAQQYIEATKIKAEAEKVREYESSQIILLDELDKVYVSRGSDYVKRTLEDYLRRMTSEGKAMVICTNGDNDYLTKTFGDSTMSALRRHLKFLSVEGDDFSESLQARWTSLMDTGKGYFDPEILSMATARMNRIKEEDRSDWEKANS